MHLNTNLVYYLLLCRQNFQDGYLLGCIVHSGGREWIMTVDQSV